METSGAMESGVAWTPRSSGLGPCLLLVGALPFVPGSLAALRVGESLVLVLVADDRCTRLGPAGRERRLDLAVGAPGGSDRGWGFGGRVAHLHS